MLPRLAVGNASDDVSHMSLITRILYCYKHAGSGKKVAAAFVAGLIVAGSALRWPSDRPPEESVRQSSAPAIMTASTLSERDTADRSRLAAQDHEGTDSLILREPENFTARPQAKAPLSQIEAERAAQAVADRENAAVLSEGKLAASAVPIAPPSDATASEAEQPAHITKANSTRPTRLKAKRRRDRAHKPPSQLAASKPIRRNLEDRALAFQGAPASPHRGLLSIFGIE